MSTLSWITPIGSLANLLAFVPTTFVVQAIDTANNGSTLTYKIISGALPDGLILNSNGTISGTPITALSTNYSTAITYNFIIRAVSSNGYVTDGGFSIILSNIVNNDFAWVTPAGNLATIPNGEFYSLHILAENYQNLPITYSLLSGSLPYGMRIVSVQSAAKVITAVQFIGDVLSLDTVQSIDAGYFIFGPNIPLSATVKSVNINAKTITLSVNFTGTFTAGTAISFCSPGYLQGVPTFLDPIGVNQSSASTFTIRATTSASHVIDRTFSITLTNVFAPVIEPNKTDLGLFFDGTFYTQQLSVIELNPNAQIQWEVKDGAMPNGITLSANGLLSGYIQPLELVGAFGPGGYDGNAPMPGASGVIANAEFDYAPYDFNQISANLTYKFTIQAFDGANYDTQLYALNVVSRSAFTADNDVELINDTFLTVDGDNVYLPILLDTSTILPVGRASSYFAYKFQGYDFTGAQLTYSIVNTAGTFDAYVNAGSTGIGNDRGFDTLWEDVWNNTSTLYRPSTTYAFNGIGGFDSYHVTAQSGSGNLPGVILDQPSGWLHGKLNYQTQATQNYEFGIIVSKTVTVDNVTTTYSSKAKYFTLPVLGEINNVIAWVTTPNLGVINNGSISELNVIATSFTGIAIVYSILDVPNVSARLPQGLILLPSGQISGRVSFETSGIDNGATTFDGKKLTIDKIYTFSIVATTIDGSASITQQFTLTIDIIDQDPYENLYLTALLPTDQRKLYHNIVSDITIFEPLLIYRADDPWFGINQNIEMLFLSGLTTETLAAYQLAIAKNNWTKTYNFGSIKTAVVLDEKYNVKYEVVYLQVIDPAEQSTTNGPALEVNLTGVISNPYIDAKGNAFKIIYPNTSENMIQRLVSNVGYYDQSSLPPWMTSNQPGNGNTFSTPIGYTQAVVLAYTVPNASKLIAYRLNAAGINFQNIQFTADRYLVDDYYSSNFAAGKWNSDTETTFDILSTKNVGKIVTDVNYAVTIPFSQLNGRPVDFINANGGIDGITTFTNGQKLIFFKQEQFYIDAPYNGWVDYNMVDAYGVNYGSLPYDEYFVVPGWLEKIANSQNINERGGIWQINIDSNNIVTLTFVLEIEANERIQVLSGSTFNGAIVYYNPQTSAGQTVPAYSVFSLTQNNSLSVPTTFNAGSTKFFSKRDAYYTSSTQGQYLKFPQSTPFL
jgi:hypothetical protein